MTRNQLEGKQFCAKCEYYYSEFYMCPICYGEQQAEQRIIKLLEDPIVMSNWWSKVDKNIGLYGNLKEYVIALIKGENK